MESNSPIDIIFIREGRVVKERLFNWVELYEHPFFDDITHITCQGTDKYRLTELPDWWPPCLQTLDFRRNKIKTFPVNLPKTIKYIYGGTNKIKTIPDLQELDNLEFFDLWDNYIELIDQPWPNSLLTVNLSYNMLKDFRTPLPLSLIELDLSFNFFNHVPDYLIGTRTRIELHHNSYQLDNFEVARHRLIQLNRDGRHIYNDGQNVHNSTIQSSANDSITFILNFKIDEYEFNNNFLEEMKQVVFPNISNPFWNLIYKIFLKNHDKNIYDHVEQWCQDTITHSIHLVTFNQVLERAWLMIKYHKDQKELIKIFKEEMLDSIGLCFTGRLTRLVNVFNGFYDDIEIKIPLTQQINARAGALLKKMSEEMDPESDEFDEKFKHILGQILDEYDLTPADRDVYLNAF